jgi:hypothetical protein
MVSGPFVIAPALPTGAMSWDSYALLNDPTSAQLAAEIGMCV